MARAGGHTLTAFDHDLGELRSLIIDMGSVAEAAIAESMRCLIEHDEVGAAELIAADEQLDDLEAEAERRAVELIALRAPMADDLREVVELLVGGDEFRCRDFIAFNETAHRFRDRRFRHRSHVDDQATKFAEIVIEGRQRMSAGTCHVSAP
jgi:phosphate uptake regulator